MSQFGTIRSARRDDLPALRELERAAGACFRAIGMAAVADDEPPDVAELAVFADDGRAWVVTDDADDPVAYLLVGVVDGNAHIEQVSVRPDCAGRGLGRALVEAAASWAQTRGLEALTLTTYAEVPWNASYYARLGFAILSDDEIGPALRRVRDDEAARGLAAWPRVTMRRCV